MIWRGRGQGGAGWRGFDGPHTHTHTHIHTWYTHTGENSGVYSTLHCSPRSCDSSCWWRYLQICVCRSGCCGTKCGYTVWGCGSLSALEGSLNFLLLCSLNWFSQVIIIYLFLFTSDDFRTFFKMYNCNYDVLKKKTT